MSENNNKAAAVVSNGCHLKGDLTLSGPLYINGSVEGNIRSTSSIVVGASGSVTGDIHSTTLIVNGASVGMVHTGNLEILEKGVVTGSVHCSKCSISKGGRLDGKVLLGSKENPESEVKKQ